MSHVVPSRSTAARWRGVVREVSVNAVVNLCFHGIGTPRRPVPPDELTSWITADQYARILDEVVRWPAVTLTFDDGNVSDVETALPGLLERGLTATFFPLAGRLDQPGSLCRADLRALAAHGMTIGTHGMRHRSWRGLTWLEREAEFVVARDRLARAVGAPVDQVALPPGRHDRRVLGELRALGYRRVWSDDRRTARAGAWLQPRLAVTRGDSVESLRAEALGAGGLVSDARAVATGWVRRLR